MDPDELRSRIAANLRAEIDRKGISITALAGLAGISREYVHRILNAEQSITVEKLVALAEVLEVEPARLLRESSA